MNHQETKDIVSLSKALRVAQQLVIYRRVLSDPDRGLVARTSGSAGPELQAHKEGLAPHRPSRMPPFFLAWQKGLPFGGRSDWALLGRIICLI